MIPSKINVLIYTGGKTGTTSLLTSFESLLGNNNVTYSHNDRYSKKVLKCPYLVKDIIDISRSNILTVISSYRDPVSRHISSFFQHIETLTKQPFSEILKMPPFKICKLIVEKMNKHFYECYHPFLENDRANIDNINIFDKPFNKEIGYQQYQTNKINLLILRFDKIANWEGIIRQNTKYKNFVLLSDNITKNKPIAPLYQQITEKIIIPHQLLDKLFDIEKKNMEYFYTQQEIEQIKKKWYRQ